MPLTKITRGALTADIIDSTKLADNAVDTEHLADDAVGLAEMASGTDGAMLTYDADGNPVAITGTDGQVATSAGAGAVSAFEAAGVSGVTSDGTDITITSGDIIFGAAGKGINLGVTSNTDSNTLDDYEEGTWTPVWVDDGGDYSATYSLQAGSYTKIGQIVHVWGYMTLTSLGQLNNNLWTIQGLPFNNVGGLIGDSGCGSIGTATGLSISAGESLTIYTRDSEDKAYVKVWNSTAGPGLFPASELTDAGHVRFTLSYITA